MRKLIAEKTWVNFMAHFQQVHQELRDTDATIDQLGFESANSIVEKIVKLLRADDEVIPPPLPPPPPQAPLVHNPPPQVP